LGGAPSQKKISLFFFYPCYSITSIKYSVFSLILLFTSFYLVDTYIKPRVINQLNIYFINKLIEEEFSIKTKIKKCRLK